MKQAPLLISLVALVGVIVLFLQAPTTPPKVSSVAPPAMEVGDNDVAAEEIEVATIMGRIQRYHQKFWVAVRANNGELAQFYLHEMEESMEEIADAGIIDDGVDLSANMRTYGIGVIEHMQEKLRSEGIKALHSEADLLVNSCNSCHQASGYGIIRIRVPIDIQIPDQDMSFQEQ